MDRATLRIRLLGGFSVEVDGALVDERAWRLRKARALVKIAALAPGRRVHRDVAADLLWPDRDAAAAANNLHQALHAARRALGDPGALTLSDDVLTLTPDAWLDVEAFEEAAAATGDPGTALALYRGELLPEDRFEEWTEGRRSALRELQLDLCVRAAERHAARGDPGAGIAGLARAVADAPRHEPVRRALMRALAGAGRRQDALAQFEALRDALRAHNEADPDPETRGLYRELLGEREPPPARRRSALPTLLTSFVGRERELAELHRLLDRTRLLTLTGPGGAGKTRLALQAAAARAAGLPGGAWLVDLGVLRDPALVPQSVATTLGVPIPANRPALDALVAHLAQTPGILVVLDTCEHVLDACAHLAEALLAADPGVRLLATSREPLRCAAEVAWRVPSLAEAPALFRERAAAVAPTAAAWTAEQDAIIEDICFRLDRMPLAVELAAARTGALTLEQIVARLGDSLDVLSAGARTALTRQQTLRATIAWSHDLLSGEERVLFRRLAVFAGGLTLEAAEAVGAGGAIPRRRVADLVARLVDKSLLGAEDGRFRSVDTIRQFADEQLGASGERDAVARRHLDWCLALAHDHDPMTATGGRSLPALEDEHDNLRGALTFALEHDPQAALALATRLWRFWLDRSWFVEGTAWMDAVLHAAPERTALRVEALLAAAGLALRRGDPDVYLRRLEETLRIYDDLDDPVATAEAHLQHALYEAYVGVPERSAQLCAEAIATAERLDHPHVAANAVHAAALAAWQRSDVPGAAARLWEAIDRLRGLPSGAERFLEAVTFGMLPLAEGPDGATRLVWEATMFPFRRLDREQALGLVLNNLAWTTRAARGGDDETRDAAVGAPLAVARDALEEALGRFRSAGDRSGEALTLAHLGHLARTVGDQDEARARLDDALALREALGERRDAGVVLLGLGLAHGAAGRHEEARRAFGVALQRFEATDDLPAMAGTRMDWAVVEERLGDLERARDLYAAGAAVWGDQRLPRNEAWGRVGLAAVLLALGDEDEAEAVGASARTAFAALGDALGITALDAQQGAPRPS